MLVLTQGDYTYTTNAAGQAAITGFNKAYTGALSITNTLGGCPVRVIGYDAFKTCASLTSVTIPAGVTSIGYSAFEHCKGLTSVTIPASVTSIGSAAFKGCYGLTNIAVDASNPAYASSDGVLFDKKFTALVRFPGGKAGAYSVPAGVTNIGNSAFSGCTGLTNIAVNAGNPTYASSDGVLFDKKFTTLVRCPGGRNGAYRIPAGVISIGNSAFSGCSGLTSVTIPAGVTSIGDFAFCDCCGLTSVTVPASVTNMGFIVFLNCTNLSPETLSLQLKMRRRIPAR